MKTIPDSMVSTRPVIPRPYQDQSTQHPRECFILPQLQEVISQAITQCIKILPPQAKILDIGCGRQPYRTLLERTGLQYFSFDVTQNEEKTVHFLGQIDEPLSRSLLTAGPFDLILLTEVLEHVFHLDLCFSNLSKLLSPGGRVILTCPFFFPLHEKPYDFWRLSSFAIEQLSKKFELDIIQHQRLGNSVDCWGLINGHLLTNMRYHAPTHFLNRIKLSLQQRMIRLVLKMNWWLARSRFLKPYFSQDQDFYVSNYFLLKNNTKRLPE